ncbi:helix-turn-helix domain-containing protein [Massilia sp. YIM B02769]|uniref:helix-turn-helix domain-containing protein n=1 Tax=Massilia sp. YIM B02769 TaxID=3050129 RepID=UPI0025B706E7|nr:helix-turn-helix domain-containing protein [Massilia sp. YIM B02769]MDN4058861.1 helix-turn-helix domain-containing protein [Massilia sp. YIM B02769]
MTSERADQGATPANHHSHPGATLAAQREAMGWSVEQVAEQLKLAVRQVVAIEAGDYAALPSPAVTRGFVRAYAKIVRLDPAPLVAMVKMDEPAPSELDGAAARRERPTSFSESRFPTHGRRSSLPLGWIVAVVVVAAAAGAAWNFGLIKLPGSDATATGDAIQTVPADGAATGAGADAGHDPAVPLISVPAQGDANAAPANGATTAPAGQAPAATPPAVQTAPASPTTTAPATTAPAANAPAAIATVPAAPAAAPAPAGANTLVLSVREDSWIEVRPQGGRALISRLVKAGSTETVEVPGTATLVVGNPNGVSATLRGAAVALPQVPGKTISRVTLNK